MKNSVMLTITSLLSILLFTFHLIVRGVEKGGLSNLIGGMLTRKGTADGTCGGQEVGGTIIWGVSIYVKDGDAWKFAFGMNSPPM